MRIKVQLKGSTASRICNDLGDVFDCIMAVTNDDTQTAMEVHGWADLASVGEEWDGDDFTAVVLDEDE